MFLKAFLFSNLILINTSLGQNIPAQEALKDIKEFEQGYNWTVLGLFLLFLLSILIYGFLLFLKKSRN